MKMIGVVVGDEQLERLVACHSHGKYEILAEEISFGVNVNQ